MAVATNSLILSCILHTPIAFICDGCKNGLLGINLLIIKCQKSNGQVLAIIKQLLNGESPNEHNGLLQQKC